MPAKNGTKAMADFAAELHLSPSQTRHRPIVPLKLLPIKFLHLASSLSLSPNEHPLFTLVVPPSEKIIQFHHNYQSH